MSMSLSISAIDAMGIIIWLANITQALLLVVWAGLVAYLIFLTLCALVARLREHTTPEQSTRPSTRFSILVPAHDEEPVIGQCLDSIMSIEYPRRLRRVIVIADNCTDNTAHIAASKGATVYTRQDAHRRGKGYALDWALKRLLREDGGWTEAVVIFDADTLADRHFLTYMDARIQKGGVALQGRYDLINPFDNWRTALLYSALLLHNRLRPLARQALGWATVLKGNGMCFTRNVVQRFGWNAYTLAEDIEYTTTLLDAGIRVEPVAQAVLYAQAPVTGRQASTQRMRWEGGRFALVKRDAPRMLVNFIRTRSMAHLDWAMDLFIPPLAILVGVPLIMLAVNLLPAMVSGAVSTLSWAWLGTLAGTAVYVLGGLLISGARPQAYLYLLCTPFFLAWKAKIYMLMLLGRGPNGWVRTERTTTGTTTTTTMSRS